MIWAEGNKDVNLLSHARVIPRPKSCSVVEDSILALASVSAQSILCTLMFFSSNTGPSVRQHEAKASCRKHHVKHPLASLNYLRLAANSAH